MLNIFYIFFVLHPSPVFCHPNTQVAFRGEVENGVDLDTMTSLEAILSRSIVFCFECFSKEGQNWVQHDRKGVNSNLVFVHPTV